MLADIKWIRKKQQMDGPGRIRAHNHLLPRLLQNAPGTWRGGAGTSNKNHCVGLRPAPPLAEFSYFRYMEIDQNIITGILLEISLGSPLHFLVLFRIFIILYYID